jgi:hypothetical protein
MKSGLKQVSDESLFPPCHIDVGLISAFGGHRFESRLFAAGESPLPIEKAA